MTGLEINIPRNIKKYLVYFVINSVILFVVYSFFSSYFSLIDLRKVQSEIALTQGRVSALNLEYTGLKSNESMIDFSVREQSLLLKLIISDFDGAVLKHSERIAKGYIFAVSIIGVEKIILIINKINKHIKNNTIKAKITNFLLKGDSASFEIEVYGNEKINNI